MVVLISGPLETQWVDVSEVERGEKGDLVSMDGQNVATEGIMGRNQFLWVCPRC